ncbi:MAG TPA: chloride channel protein [Stellaceae bacterium]|nr:chloride channel protein [Stellaceae bacterium]
MSAAPPPASPLDSAITPPTAEDAPAAGRMRPWLSARLLFREWLDRLIQRNLRDNEIALVAISAVLGAAAGIGVIAIEGLVQLFHQLNFAIAAGGHLSEGGAIAWWRILLVPTTGGLLAGTAANLIRRRRPHETVDAIEANALFGGRMSLTDSVTLTGLTMISSGFGASVGMEAGFTQLGAGFSSHVGQRLRMRRSDLRTLVGAGAAAAIAAAFNAPLAGAFYAFELVIGGYSAPILAPIAIAALAATLVVRGMGGGVDADSIFALDQAVHIHSLDYVLFAGLGVIAAAIAVATMTGVTWVERLFRRLKVPVWLRPCIGGALVGLIAVIFPEVLGSGHGAIQASLDHKITAGVLLGLVAAKGLASAISVGSGFRGGLFSSSLLLGSVYGGTAVVFIQAAVSALDPAAPPLDQAAYMLVGMSSVAAAVIGAPLTMIFLVLELTGSFVAALGVMVGVIIASVVVRMTFGYSFATWRFHLRGVPIRGGYDVGWVQDLTVEKLMRRDFHTAPLGMALDEFRAQFPVGGTKRVFLVDALNRYRGMVVTADAHDRDVDNTSGPRLIDDLRVAEDQFLLPQQNVRLALDRFVSAEVETLAVVSDAVERRVVGFLTEGYALRRYNQEFERVRAAELGERTLFGPG